MNVTAPSGDASEALTSMTRVADRTLCDAVGFH